MLPSDRTLLVERFRDELGDWRLVVHSPYGTPVHAPWALAINARLRERYGIDGQAMASDDGIVIRIPDTDAEPPGGEVVVFEPDEIEELVTDEVGGSALFASRFRECAARALLLPRRDPGRRSPLWQQRQRAAPLLEVAAEVPVVPDRPRGRPRVPPGRLRPARAGRADARVDRARGPGRRRRDPAAVARSPAPCCSGTSPSSSTRATPRSPSAGPPRSRSTRACWPSCSAAPSCASCSTPRCSPRSRPSCSGSPPTAGPATPRASPTCCGCSARSRTDEVRRAASTDADVDDWLETPGRRRGACVEVRMAGEERWAAVEDVGRLRDGLGVAVPPGIPDAFTEPVDDPLADLVARYARTHGPFTADDVAARLGLGAAVVRHTLQRLGAAGPGARRRVPARPAPGTEWCDAEVLRRLRRPLAGPAAQGGRAGRAGGAGPVPRRLAARRARHRAACAASTACSPSIDQLAGCAGAGRGARAAGAGRPGPRLRAVVPRRAHRLRRGALGRPRRAARHRRLGLAAPRRPGAADPARRTSPFEHCELHQAVLDALAPGGAWFFRQLSDAGRLDRRQGARRRAVGPGLGRPDQQRHPHPAARAHPRRHARPPHPAAARPAPDGLDHRPRRMPARTGPPETAGRWALLPALDADPTRRAHAAAERLLDRHGVVTRGAVVSERVPGGFAAVYKVLSAFEDSGRCRRGYFVDGLGAAQFGTVGRDRPAAHLRRGADDGRQAGRRSPWPPPTRPTPTAPPSPGPTERRVGPPARPQGRRPGGAGRRRRWSLYVERGGRTLLTWTDDPTGWAGDRRSTARRGRWPLAEAATARRCSAGSPSRGPTASTLLGLRGHDARCVAGSSCTRAGLRGATPPRGAPAATRRVAARQCPRATPSGAPPGSSTARCGQALAETDFRVPQLATADLTGGTVVETVSRGKHLLTRIDRGRRPVDPAHPPQDGGLLAGLTPRQRWPRPAHTARVVLEPPGPTAVGFPLGVVELVRPRSRGPRRRPPRPRPARPRLGRGRALANLTADPTSRHIGEALLDQRCLAGIGTVWRAETLFLTGVNPFTPVPDVADLRGVVQMAHRLLKANKERAVQATTGSTRRGEQFYVYSRRGQPCRRCGPASSPASRAPGAGATDVLVPRPASRPSNHFAAGDPGDPL